MLLVFFINLLSRAKPSRSTASVVKDSFVKPSSHSCGNSKNVEGHFPDPHVQRQPRIKRKVEPRPRPQRRHAECIPAVPSMSSSTIAPTQASRPQDAEDALDGLNGMILKKFKRQFSRMVKFV